MSKAARGYVERGGKLTSAEKSATRYSVTSQRGPGDKTTEATPKPEGGIKLEDGRVLQDLIDYWSGNNPSNRSISDDAEVVIYSGKKVGKGGDNEPLSVPDMKVVYRTTWKKLLSAVELNPNQSRPPEMGGKTRFRKSDIISQKAASLPEVVAKVKEKKAGESLEMQNQCAEIKVRAERRAGEILKVTVKPGNPKLLHDETITSLPDGITRVQSHRWQAILSRLMAMHSWLQALGYGNTRMAGNAASQDTGRCRVIR